MVKLQPFQLDDGYSEFTDLTDTPASYAGQIGKAIIVNDTEDGLKFGVASGSGLIDGYLPLPERGSDPSYQDNYGSIYTKDVGGTTALFYIDDDGTLSRLDGYDGGGGAGNTLDQAYDEGGAGAGRSITADSGAVQIDASGGAVEALDIDGYVSLTEISDPSPTNDNRGFLYTKDIGGVTALFYMDDDGTLSRLDGYDGGGGGGNTLDQAYDEGGAGAGRSITADSGAVVIDASGDEALEIDGYITLDEISDPTALADAGLLYTKESAGITELFYRDSSGNIRQLTPTTAVGNTLNQAYDQGGAGVGRSITADAGAVSIDASGGTDEALDLDGYVSLTEINDPTPTNDNRGFLYTKDIGGTTALFYMDDDGTLSRLDGYDGGGGSGNTLDQAYDEGGAGAGRSITADSGAVEINASGDMVLDLDGYISMDEISDPTNIANKGFVYAKDVSGITELFYMDDSGSITQITSDGYLDTFNSLEGVGLFKQSSEPTPAVDKGFVYTKDVGGTTALFYMDESGTLSRLDGYGGGGVGNTLNQAYDQGGAGAGRSITADSGAVSIDASGGTDEALDLDGYVSLTEINDPTPTNDNRGFLYAKDIGGTTGLFYMDDDGTLSRLDGYDGGGGAGNTLNQAYDEGGAGAGRSITADSGAVQIDASGDMALDLDGYVALTEISDPSPLANYGMLYTKDIGGTTALFYMDESGTLSRLDGYGSGGAGNTLDQAYDEGGAGAGRSITADSGPVAIDASGGTEEALDIDGYISLTEITDPTATGDDRGFLYAKNDDAYSTSELFYMDDSGQITQITQDGYLATYNSLRGIRLLEGVELPQQAGSFSIYAKDSNGVTELFGRDSDNNELQMTIQGRLNFNGVANGLDVTEAELSADFSTSSGTFVDVDNGGGDALEVDVSVVEGERLMILLEGYIVHTGGTNRVDVQYDVDGTAIPTTGLIGESSGTNYATGLGSLSPIITPAQSAGTTTIKVQTRVSSNGADWKQGAKLKVIRFKSGYVQPENIPILEYNSASVVDVISGPGASSELRATLNDGRRYTATSPLSVDLTTNGPGGLDTGSEAVSTWYHIYIIPGTTSESLDAIASERDPDGYGGPDGYDVSRWIGAIYNNSSSNIRQFWQVGDWFYSEADPADNELVLISTGAATKNNWVNLSTVLAAAIPVDVADSVIVRGYVDGDDGQVNQLHVEPGNPPGFTPSSLNEGDQALCLIRVQDSSQGTATRAIELFDGTLSYYMLQISGSGNINLGLVATAWKASRLVTREARAQAPYQPDTKSPKGTWADGYSVDFDARPGQPATTRLTLQDGVQRTMTTGTWDGYTNGIADWGYDEAGSQGNSKWLYFYAVPKSGDDDSLVVRASDNAPSTGPAGYSNWKMVWAAYIDSSGDLLKVYQRSNSFRFSESIVDAIGSGTDGSPVSYSLTSYVPDSAGDVRLFVYNNGDGTNYRWVDFWADGDQGNATSALRVVCEERQTTAFELATPTSPKKIYYQRDNVTACSFFFTGWVDEWIDP